MRRVILGPTFELEVPLGAAEASERLAAGLGEAGVWVRRSGEPGAARHGSHFLISVGRDRRWFWSPWLTFEFVRCEGGRCVGSGRFNPSPSIWTGFVLGGMTLLTLAMGGLVWATAEWMLGRPMQGLWLTAGASAGVCALFTASAVGQGLARSQMEELEALVRGLVERAGTGQSAGG